MPSADGHSESDLAAGAGASGDSVDQHSSPHSAQRKQIQHSADQSALGASRSPRLDVSKASRKKPIAAETTDAPSTPSFTESSSVASKASSAINRAIVKPMPVKKLPADSSFHERPSGRMAARDLTARKLKSTTPAGFPTMNATTIANVSVLLKSAPLI